MNSESEVMDRGLIITSNADISLYASNHNVESYDATNVLPIEALSKEYIIQTFSGDRQATEFAVVATKNNTTIKITPSDSIKLGDSFSTDSFTVILNEGQAYQVRGFRPQDDLSGTIICANQEIAVFNGGQSAKIPLDYGTDDHIVEQSLPTYMWGKEFVVTGSAIQDVNVVKVTAMYDGTKIYIDNVIDTILNKAESYEFALYKSTMDPDDIIPEDVSSHLYAIADAIYLNSSYPIMCFLYHSTQDANSMKGEYRRFGDPSMIFIPPLEQSIDEISFLTYNINKATTYHYVNIITKTSNVNEVELDNGKIASQFVIVPGNTKYSFARIKLGEGSHKIISSGDGF